MQCVSEHLDTTEQSLGHPVRIGTIIASRTFMKCVLSVVHIYENYNNAEQNVTGEWLTLLLRTREVQSSNIGRKTGFSQSAQANFGTVS
jgi:hypothetical protein